MVQVQKEKVLEQEEVEETVSPRNLQIKQMARPKKIRNIEKEPNIRYFKPQGVPLRDLEEVILGHDELEAIRLYEVENLDQKAAAIKMKVSQPTFARILDKALKNICEAIVNGKAIRIED